MVAVTGIHVVADWPTGLPLGAWLDQVRPAVGTGITAVQVRARGRSAAEVFSAVNDLWPWCRRTGCALLVNDRVDVAAAGGADGVHLGQTSLPVAAARRVVGPDRLVGVSVHSLAEAEAAWSAGADYLMFGHVYASGSKPGLPPRGVELLAEVCRRSPVPVVALGGMAPDRLAEVRKAGAAGAAVLSYVMASSDPAAAARALADAWRAGVVG